MMLKRIRVILGILSFVLITFFFVDFAGLIPAEHFSLAKIQFFPALIAGSFGILVILLLLTLLFGRVYCSVICPMGVFQDVVSRVAKRFNRKRKYRFSPEKRGLRYGMLAAVVLTYFSGFTVLLSLLEPYSAYGRMTNHLLRPVYMAGNNLLAVVFNHFDNFAFYHTEIFMLGLLSLVTAILTFLVIGFLAWKYGRTYCNTFCPVGTILGLVSRFAMFRVRIKEESCNNCGLCSMNCKASCIDSKNEKVDNSRCVGCFNCLTVCKKKAVKYEFAWKKEKKVTVETPEVSTLNSSKRRFFSILGVAVVAATTQLYAKGLTHLSTNVPWKKKHPLSPPGSLSAEHLLHHCTACHLCVAKCPSRVLKPALGEYGLGGVMQPVMDFQHGFCNYDCTLCSEVCPNGALRRLTQEEKHTLQMGRVVFLRSNCVVYTDETFCGACSEHCPTQAVAMVPYKNGLTIPSVNPDICVGCGGCEYVCPAKPYRAIYVEGNPIHQQAKHYQEAVKKEVQIDSFGF